MHGVLQIILLSVSLMQPTVSLTAAPARSGIVREREHEPARSSAGTRFHEENANFIVRAHEQAR
jgi:hypothetical protein